MMKKILSIFMILMLLIPTMAFAAEGDLTYTTMNNQMESFGITSDTSFQRWCALGDTFYVLTYDGKLIAQKAGETDPKVYSTDLNQTEEDDSYADPRIFAANDKLYVLNTITNYGSDSGETLQSKLYEIALTDTELTKTELFDVDLNSLRTSDGYMYLNYIISTGNYLLLNVESDDGNGTGIWAMSLTDGSFQYITVPSTQSSFYLLSLTEYTNGTALAQMWSDDSTAVVFYQIDPAAATCETIATIPVENYESFNGLATDMETGTLYCVNDGEICTLDLATGAVSEGITDIKIDSTTSGYILTGGYYAAADYQSYAVRNINPGQQNERKLKIVSQNYDDSVDAAYYTFANAHGDVSVVYSHDYNIVNNLVEDMMNRDSSVDVFIMYTDSEAYSALYDRGYLADFTDSEKLMAFSQTIDSTFLEQLSVNGRFSVLPVEAFIYEIPFLHTAALEKAGISVNEVPTNWLDFLKWLPTLEGRLPEGTTVFDPWTSGNQAKSSLFYNIFQCYQEYISIDANSVSTEDMIEILDALNSIDFEALGQPTDEEVNSDTYSPEWEDQNILMEINTGISFAGITRGYTPIAMALTGNVDPIVPINTAVAVINPYSKNIDLALEYLETLADNLSDNMTYMMCTDRTEPTQNKWYESSIQNEQAYIDELKAQLETADDADKQAIQVSIESAEEDLQSMETYRYEISEDDIAWMSAHRSQLVMASENWLYSTDNGDAYTLVQQYLDGQIDASRLMKEIDRKVRMRILEGA